MHVAAIVTTVVILLTLRCFIAIRYTRALVFYLPCCSPKCPISFIPPPCSDVWQIRKMPRHEASENSSPPCCHCLCSLNRRLSPHPFFSPNLDTRTSEFDISGPTSVPNTRGLTSALNSKWGHILVKERYQWLRMV